MQPQSKSPMESGKEKQMRSKAETDRIMNAMNNLKPTPKKAEVTTLTGTGCIDGAQQIASEIAKANMPTTPVKGKAMRPNFATLSQLSDQLISQQPTPPADDANIKEAAIDKTTP